MYGKIASKVVTLNMCRLMYVLIACTVSYIPIAERFGNHTVFSQSIINGTFGENITWTLADGTLTLSGTGETENGTLNPVEFPITEFTSETLHKWENGKWSEIADEVKHLVVTEGITGIGTQAFMLFDQLETVILPDSVESIGSMAFAGCPLLTEIEIPGAVEFASDVFLFDTSLCNPKKPFFIVNGTLVAYGGEAETHITIPEGVVSILENVFLNHSELESVALPDTITEIGSCAFSGCSNLKRIEIPSGTAQIAASTFHNCTSLQSVALPEGTTQIGQQAFYNCTALSQINLPASLVRIEADAFFGCTALPEACRTADGFLIVDGKAMIGYDGAVHELRIPEGTTVMADETLYESGNGNTAIISVVCPDSLRFIGSGAFQNCALLMNLTLNEGLVAIGENALAECDSLTTLVIPETVTEIGTQENNSLTDIYGTSGTAAEQFANENGITFHNKDELLQYGEDMTLDYTKDGWGFGNSGAVFGTGYYLNDADRQYLTDNGIDTKSDQTWSGSCVGLAVSVILAQNGLFSPSQLQPGAESLCDVTPTDDVLSFINFYQCIQGRDGTSNAYEPTAQRFYRMLQIAKEIPNGESPFLLVYTTASGTHGVVGYGQEEETWIFDGKTYDGRILIWDSNFHTALREDACLYYDSQTFDYCIPYYGVHVTDGASDNVGGIQLVCNDISVLNAYPYPFSVEYEEGDLNCDGQITVADAILLSRLVTEDLTEDVMTIPTASVASSDFDSDGLLTVNDVSLLLQKMQQDLLLLHQDSRLLWTPTDLVMYAPLMQAEAFDYNRKDTHLTNSSNYATIIVEKKSLS